MKYFVHIPIAMIYRITADSETEAVERAKQQIEADIGIKEDNIIGDIKVEMAQ